MAKTYYLPADDEGKAALLEHFATTISGYAAALGLPAAELTAQAADTAYFRWLVNESIASRAYAQALTAWRDSIRDGGIPATPQAPVPSATPAPATVPAGIVPRFTALVKRIKGHPAYTEAIGEALRIVGAESAGPDTATAQPDLTGAKVVADEVRIPWKKGKFDGIRIEVDRGDGKGWTFLAIDTRPDYSDTEPFPAVGAIWKYRAIYLLDDQKVGQWSPTVSVNVG